MNRAGADLLAIVARSAKDEHDYRPPPAPDEQQKKLLKTLQETVRKCADELGISPELVASRRELSALILSGSTDSRVFRGWRRPLIGERLLQLL